MGLNIFHSGQTSVQKTFIDPIFFEFMHMRSLVLLTFGILAEETHNKGPRPDEPTETVIGQVGERLTEVAEEAGEKWNQVQQGVKEIAGRRARWSMIWSMRQVRWSSTPLTQRCLRGGSISSFSS